MWNSVLVPADQLAQDGVLVLEKAIHSETLKRVRLQAEKDEPHVTYGENGLPNGYEVYPENYYALVKHAAQLLSSIGAMPIELKQVTLIPKRPLETARELHVDIAEDRRGVPQDLFVLYYLDDASVDKGCLCVKSGNMPVRRGDVVLLDPRLEHGSTANTTENLRLLVRIWMRCSWK